MTDGQCRWGILGTAFIAQKNWQAIRNAANCSLHAVGSRSSERAQQFIDMCQASVPQPTAPQAVGSYEELIEHPEIDAVYIPLPTGVRKEWVLKAAAAGKHVLVEKPVGVTTADVRELIEACREHNVQFMDGVMFMHSRRLDAVRACLNDPQAGVGDLRRIASQFSFLAPEEFRQSNIRVSSQLEPAGCLGDLGWYNIRFSLWVMDWQLPDAVRGRTLAHLGRSDSPSQVPVDFTGEMQFGSDVSASLYCSFLTEHQQWAHVSGTRGNLRLDDFVLPNFGSEVDFEVTNAVFDIDCCHFRMEPHARRVSVAEYSDSTATAQESRMFQRFAQAVLSGDLEAEWGEYALKTQQVLDALLQSAAQDGAAVDPSTL